MLIMIKSCSWLILYKNIISLLFFSYLIDVKVEQIKTYLQPAVLKLINIFS